MANTDNARGLVPVGGSSGPYNGQTQRVMFLAATGTACYVGSVVKPTGTADANGLMEVTANVSTGNLVLGAVVSIEPVTADSLTYRAASTLRYALVATDPNQIYEAQVSASIAATDIGTSADLVNFTSGSTVYGNSTTEVDSTTFAAGDGTEDVLVLGAVQRPGNDLGTNCKVLVKLNNHYLADASAGIA